MVVLRCKHIVLDNCSQYLYDGVFVRSFSEDGIETAETAYALALAYTNVHDDEAESRPMSPCRNNLRNPLSLMRYMNFLAVCYQY